MRLRAKKEKKPKEPQYYLSATNIPTYNYNVYYLGKIEKILCFLIMALIGAAVGYLFYGGIGKDEYGNATTMTHVLNCIVCILTGVVVGKKALPIRTERIVAKKKKALNTQFRDMLEGLTTSVGAGNNVIDSFEAVYTDMKIQYEEDAAIIKELEVIISGINNNIDIEDLLMDFGKRSGIPDIVSFAEVFNICYRKGGNIKDVIHNTHTILSEKMEIREDIETIITANKTEQNMMLMMPVGIVGIIKLTSPEFAANFVTPAGIAATTIGLACFVISYYVGKKVMSITV